MPMNTTDKTNGHTPHNVEERAVDHEKHAYIQALKSIVPPPYMLQVDDIEAILRKGYTEATAHIENEKRQKQYENVIGRLYNYVTTAHQAGFEAGKREEGEELRDTMIAILEYIITLGDTSEFPVNAMKEQAEQELKKLQALKSTK